MTDHKDDKQKTPSKMSFKEQILAELEKANQIRKEKEEELHQQGLREDELRQKEIEVQKATQRTAELYHEYQKEAESQTVKDSESLTIGETQPQIVPLSANHLVAEAIEVSEIESTESFSENNSLEEDSGSESYAVYSESETSPLEKQTTSDRSNTNQTDFSESQEESLEKSDENFKEDESDLSKTIPFTLLMANDLDPTGLTTESQATILSNDDIVHYNHSENDKETLTEKQNETSTDEGGLVKKRAKRQHVNRLANKISLMIIAGILALMLLVAVIGTTYVYSAVNPIDKTDKKYVQVEIPVGSGNKLIGQILEEKGLIKNSTVFNFYTKFKNYGNFQSGYYNLQKSMSMGEIAKSLQIGGTAEPTKPVLGKVLIPEGYSIRQMAKAMENNVNTKSTKDKSPFSSETFLKVISDDVFIKEMVKKYPRLLSSIPKKSDAIYQLEGYLFPATYNYYKGSSEKEMIDQMLATTDATMANYYDQIENDGKTVNEVLTLASLVEKEGSTDEDRRDIASVFYNRLNNGMALQSNIAILYAMGKLGDKTSLAEDASIDTTIKSPYNIYTNTGLMPGPVDSPGVSAIEATVKPANTDYLYFVANVKTGEVFYAKTYEQHSANVEKYVNSQIQ